MSGGGKKVPKAPDVSTNIGNANQTYQTATSNAGQVLNTAQGYNTNAQNLLSDIVGSTTPVMDAVNNASTQGLQSYGQNFIPLQGQQAADAASYANPANVARMKGRAIADVNAANAASRKASMRALGAEGVDPASIQGRALDRQAAIQQAGQVAKAGTQSVLDTENTGRALVNQANNLGLQVGQVGQAGGATGAGIGAQLVGTENATNASNVNNLLAPATYLNTGINANTSAANIASQNYQDQLARWQQQNGANNGLMGNIASLGGAAMSMFGGGGGGNVAHAGMADGGVVPHAGALPESPIPGSTDTKPAFLTPGEFVIPKDVVAHKGAEFFHKLVDSTRIKANERKAIPEPVYAHKTMNHSTHHAAGGMIPGYAGGGVIGDSASGDNSLSPVARLGAVGQKYTDPLAWIFGKKWTNFTTKLADKSNAVLNKATKPLQKIDKTINPVRRFVPGVDKIASWTEKKPLDTAAIAAGAFFGGSALGGMGGGGGGGGTAGANGMPQLTWQQRLANAGQNLAQDQQKRQANQPDPQLVKSGAIPMNMDQLRGFDPTFAQQPQGYEEGGEVRSYGSPTGYQAPSSSEGRPTAHAADPVVLHRAIVAAHDAAVAATRHSAIPSAPEHHGSSPGLVFRAAAQLGGRGRQIDRAVSNAQ